MIKRNLGNSFRWIARGCSVVLFLIGLSIALPVRADTKVKAEAGFFFSVSGAKDCAFDQSRQRLYVTTGKKLVILDTKKKKTIESIDLAGGVRSCDISPDFKFLAIAPLSAHAIYWINLEDFQINQVRFKAGSSESGVYDLCVGKDNTVLFSMTFAGSGGVMLRKFDPKTKKVSIEGRVHMDAIVSASVDRRYAAIAEGNISSAPLKIYDFEKSAIRDVAKLGGFHYEIACGRNAKYFARPQSKGCFLYDEHGGRLALIESRPVICAAFHPKADRLYIMRDGDMSIQEYDIERSAISNAYPLDKPLVIRGDVHESVVGQLLPFGRAQFRRVKSVSYRTFRSGRLKVSENGKKLFAVVPTGVYMFSIDVPEKADVAKEKKKHRINVIEAD